MSRFLTSPPLFDFDGDITLSDSVVKTQIGDGWNQLHLTVIGRVGFLTFSADTAIALSSWQEVRIADLPAGLPAVKHCVMLGSDGTRGLTGVCLRADSAGHVYVINRNDSQARIMQATLQAILTF